ncbi:MAG: hypothetical protein PHV85_00150 [Desulfovibrionaceae bacterium]|nr:hypothetical protein [Desulfovibrionaceae bacterium]
MEEIEMTMVELEAALAPEPGSPKAIQHRVQEIKSELAALDAFLPRAVEDLVEAGVKGLSQYNLDRLAIKQALRIELAGLE